MRIARFPDLKINCDDVNLRVKHLAQFLEHSKLSNCEVARCGGKLL